MARCFVRGVDHGHGGGDHRHCNHVVGLVSDEIDRRSLAHLKALGYVTEVVEKTDPQTVVALAYAGTLRDRPLG